MQKILILQLAALFSFSPSCDSKSRDEIKVVEIGNPGDVDDIKGFVVFDRGGILKANVKPNLGKTQRVTASVESLIDGAFVRFPENAFDVETEISIQEGASLISEVELSQVGLSADDIAFAGPAVMVTASPHRELIEAMTVVLPFPEQLSLIENFNSDNMILLYKKKAGDGSLSFGFQTLESISVWEELAIAETKRFGVFQLVYTKEKQSQPASTSTDVELAPKFEILSSKLDLNQTATYSFDADGIEIVGSRARLKALVQSGFEGVAATSVSNAEMSSNAVTIDLKKIEFPDKNASDGWIDASQMLLLTHLNESVAATSAVNEVTGGTTGTDTATKSGMNGKVGGARLMGDGSFIDFGDLSSLNLSFPLSISAWIRLDQLPSLVGEDGVIASKRKNSGDDRGWEYKVGVNDRLSFEKWSDGTAGTSDVIQATTAWTSADLGKWKNVVLTIDAAGNWRFYLNGVLDGNGSSASWTNGVPIFSSSAKFYLGAVEENATAPDSHIRGGLDEIGIWSRVLSEQDVALVYEKQNEQYFQSHLIDGTVSTAWSGLKWDLERPYGKGLPSGNQIESGYSIEDANADMSENSFLYHLDEPTGCSSNADSSVNGLDMTPTNGVVCGGTGVFGGSATFDGVDDYLTLDQTSILNLDPTESFTVAMWVKPASFGAWQTIYSTKTGPSYLNLFSLNSVDADWGPVADGVAVGWSDGGTNHLIAHSIDNVLFIDQWSHVAVTYDAAVSMGLRFRIYVNGFDVTDLGDVKQSGNLQAFLPRSTQLGSEVMVSGREFEGDLDEVARWSEKLSSDSIRELYLRGALRIDFQVRTCDNPSCDGRSFGGPGSSTFYSENNNTGASLGIIPITVEGNRYFQYRMRLFTSTLDGAMVPKFENPMVTPQHFVGSGASLVWVSDVKYHSALTFEAEFSGDVQFQVSNDGGSVWRWFDGQAWVSATQAGQSNTVGDIDQNIQSFPLVDGSLQVRAVLLPSGSTSSELESIRLEGLKIP